MAVHFGVIISPCQGRVERVEITNESRIYEWDPLFYIKTPEGNVEVVQLGVSGEIESLEVQVGGSGYSRYEKIYMSPEPIDEVMKRR